MPLVDTTRCSTSPTFEVVPASDHPGDWIVEAIETEKDGEVLMARFSGPRARERALEYADWKNSH